MSPAMASIAPAMSRTGPQMAGLRLAIGLNALAELVLELAMGVLAVDVMGVLSGEGCGVEVGVKEIMPFVIVIDT